MLLELADIVAARRRIADGIYLSPCPESIPLSEITGVRALCKLDYLQRTGSFKERGARNALLELTPQQRAAGVVAASAGNHALGLAYHGQLLGIGITVVMPKFAPLVKITTCRRLGASVLLYGDAYADARHEAGRLAAERQLTYIPGFDDPDAILTGVETRTSSPVRITRGEDFQSLNTAGLYPGGEGAGYAGGILSAAVDGVKLAEAVALSASA